MRVLCDGKHLPLPRPLSDSVIESLQRKCLDQVRMFNMPDKRTTFEVDLQPVGCRVQVGAGTTLLGAAQSAGVELQSICGGVGTCGSCKVRVATGSVSLATATENHEISREEMA